MFTANEPNQGDVPDKTKISNNSGKFFLRLKLKRQRRIPDFLKAVIRQILGVFRGYAKAAGKPDEI